MKTALLSAATLLAIAQPAFADPVALNGKAADAFIATSFPNADIPGPVDGKFTYARDGQQHVGHAKCFVPAMGARSEGAVSTCKVWY
ncbi:hypothetical protein DFR50_13613 [Roseiarcus fermentans]|uniref:Uncharacterized protein n=1 Tax=Roseiarcus fermentans TaxID=1473586 RepID=A0A366ES45_9HYPH|nr:hypothetical protein [Roseiarcus fermentans]RBP05124.1 hypothetical protein DFR50_13613 [Roseiarcus fermentans]